jgi:iron complex transport system substrate-binding protein
MKCCLFAILIFSTLWIIISWGSVSHLTVLTDCYEVKHAAGTTCVPQTIQRLVTLDTVAFENAVALGLKPIGAVFGEQSLPSLQHQAQSITAIGQTGSPNMERILMLKPDLILGLSFHQEIYSQLAQIAPTVLLELEHSGEWKSLFRQFGEVLRRSTIADQVLQGYRLRLQAFKQQFTAQTTPQVISVVRIYPDNLSLYLRDSFVGVILHDAGLDRPATQNFTAAEGQQQFGNPIQASVSLEYVEQVDADVVFVWTSENTVEANEIAQKRLKEILASRLWHPLKAIQNQQVYAVPSYWIGSGPLAANAVIDDLLKYLPPPKTPNNLPRSQKPPDDFPTVQTAFSRLSQAPMATSSGASDRIAQPYRPANH